MSAVAGPPSGSRRTCGVALVELLERYGVETVFGIPGVHTLEYFRGFAASRVRPVLARHEQGAAFMADGYARATGRMGVCCVITGPGVTNAATGLAQAYSDSVPVLALASVNRSESLGRGWGDLHETQDQLALAAQLVGRAEHASSPADVPQMLSGIIASFADGRPRPGFLQVPIDVLGATVDERWEAATPRRERQLPDRLATHRAAAMLRAARRPALLAGGGCVAAAAAVRRLVEVAQLPVVTTVAGKGVLAEDHPLCVGASLWRGPTQRWLADRDLLIAVGTELAETDTLVERLSLPGPLIRVDVDVTRFEDRYPATLELHGDAALVIDALAAELPPPGPDESERREDVRRLRAKAGSPMTPAEAAHQEVLRALRDAIPSASRVYTDMTQLAYAGSLAFPVAEPRRWLHPVGYGTLGYALPAAIGGALGDPAVPTVALVGDGGLLYTIQEMATAAELGVPLVVILWNNDALGQIRDDMVRRGIPPTCVLPANPDFGGLAAAFGWRSERPRTLEEVRPAVERALSGTGPALVELHERTLFPT